MRSVIERTLPSQAPDLGDGFIAFRAGGRVESDPARLVLLILADVGLDPAMGMLLADVHGSRSARSSRPP